ncbi:DUF2567 domain-containing protein [Streptomyces hebeiensis]
MTAPLTPPHQPRHDGPWQTPPGGATPCPVTETGDEGPDLRTEVLQAAVVLVAVTLLGLLLGALWLWLAPKVPLVSDSTAVFLKDTEGEEAIAADGIFALLALGFGVVSGALVFVLRRHGGIPLVLALALGGLLGAVLAWQFGSRLGPTPDVLAHAQEAGKGVTFDAPLELNAKGALLSWPLAAMVVHLALTAVFGPKDPEPEWTAPPPPAPQPENPPHPG